MPCPHSRVQGAHFWKVHAMKRHFVGLVLCLGGLAACQDNKPSTPPAAPPPPKPGVITLAPSDVTITTEVAGRVLASKVAEVRPQVSGIIEERLFTEGAEVKEGDVLYRIADAPYEAAVESAKAVLDRAKGAVTAAVNKADRYKTLSTRDIASQQDFEAATAAAAQARADVAAAQANLEAARINLDRTRIRAPISGRIGTSALTVGALVTANQGNALATIQTLDPVFVDVPESATVLLRTRLAWESGTLKSPGDAVPMTILLDGGKAYPHTAPLRFANAAVSEATATVTLRGTVANPDRFLLPGMFVRGTAVLGTQPGALAVPQRAVQRNPRGQAFVMIVGEDNKVEERIIEVSRAVGNRWLVDAGLKAGDRIIMDGLQRVRPGMQVSPVPFEEAPAKPAGKP